MTMEIPKFSVKRQFSVVGRIVLLQESCKIVYDYRLKIQKDVILPVPSREEEYFTG